MAYEVTATRKRPQALTQLVDQEFVVATLKSSIENGRIAHAYIFSGPRGVGKTSAARILAKSLNCENGPTPTPCGTCNSCLEITKGNSLDVIEIDGASNTSVNDVREIKDEVLFAPNSCKYKVYIIDEVHMLSNSAFNALLKTIEEPPPYIIFIFATTEIHKVPATIRSRCQQFNFKLISISKIKDKLTETIDEMGMKAEERALFWIAKESTGSMRDAYTLFDQVVAFSDGHITLDKIREKLGIVGIDEMNDLVELLVEEKTKETLEYSHNILTKGIAVEQFTIELIEYFRNILFLKHKIDKDNILGYPAETFSSKVINHYTIPQLEIAIDTLLNLYRNLRYSVNQRFELELIISRLSCLKDYIPQNEIIHKIQEIKKELSSGNITVQSTSEQLSSAENDIEDTFIEKKNEYSEIESSEENAPQPESHDLEEKNQSYSVQENLISELIKYLQEQKKMALAATLEKVESWSVENEDLILNYNIKDKFSSEKVKREKKIIQEAIEHITANPLKIQLNFIQPTEQTTQKDERVKILKDIFNGEIVKGE